MTALVAFVCRGGRGGGGKTVIIRCDEPGCGAETSYSDRAGYLAAGEAGWRRVGEQTDPHAWHGCPAHPPS